MIKLVSKGIMVAAKRPMEFFGNVRAYLLFRLTRLGAKLLLPAEISLGTNVRLQRLSCLSAEKPQARISIGDHCIIYEYARIAAYGNGQISIGERAIVGDVRIYSRQKISIGKRAIFSWNVFIQDFHPHPIDPKVRGQQLCSMTDHFLPSFDGHRAEGPAFKWDFPTDPVELGDDIWFGANCTILPGVKIGAGSIVAAGAVVVKGEYPARSVLAGNPARLVKEIP